VATLTGEQTHVRPSRLFKLNQHKSDTDHIAVARALRDQSDPSARAIAARMLALKPHLTYE